jgi:hypothetical protein
MEFQERRIAENICRRKKTEWKKNNLEGIEEYDEKRDVRQLYVKTDQIKKRFQS